MDLYPLGQLSELQVTASEINSRGRAKKRTTACYTDRPFQAVNAPQAESPVNPHRTIDAITETCAKVEEHCTRFC